jgi:hypothetical protein
MFRKSRLAALTRCISVAAAAFFTFPQASYAQVAAPREARATYTGTMGCPTGSFLDIGRSECWSCPTATPARTVFPVTGAEACERPLHEEFRRASGPKNPTGLIGTDCQPGWFLDIGHGKCYSCNGYNRTLHPVTHARACARMVGPTRSRATLVDANAYCPTGSFQHMLSGKCYSCPEYYDRNLLMGDDPSKFNACTFSNAGIARERGLAKLEELAPQMADAMIASLTLSNDSSTKARLNNKDSALAADASQAVGANPCGLDIFNTWSLGATAGADAVIGVTGETGMAVDIRKAAREGAAAQRNAVWYADGSWSLGLNAGASAGVNYGCWVDDNNDLGGDYHGFSFDVLDIGKLGVALKAAKGGEHVKDAFSKSGASLAFGVWFDYDWRFLGVSMTPAFGRGISLGGYSKGGTFQFP